MSDAAAAKSAALGYVSAVIGVVLTATYPAMTRPIFVGGLSGPDLFALRVGVSAMLFLPYLAWRARQVPRRLWLAGIPLSFFQGWGMAALVIGGLRFAPASHSSSLGPGMLSTSVAVLGYLIYGTGIRRLQAIGIGAIVSGVLAIVGTSLGTSIGKELIGDVMFLGASVFGAVYLLSVQHNRLPPILSAAVVSIYSALIVLPWYWFAVQTHFANASLREIGIQIFVQGIIRGGICFVALNYSISMIGSQKTSSLYALLPALGLICSISIAKDPASWSDWLAVLLITGGVLAGVMSKRQSEESGRAVTEAVQAARG